MSEEDEYADLFDDFEDEVERPHGVQFGEGQPHGRGRPKGSPNRVTIIKRVANQRHKVREGGKAKTYSVLELVLRTIRTAASQGNVRAFDLQERLKAKYAPSGHQPRITISAFGSRLTAEEAMVFFPNHKPYEEILAEFPYLKHVVDICKKGEESRA